MTAPSSEPDVVEYARASHPYGYVLEGQPRKSSRERLVAMFERGVLPTRIDAVWTPETGLVPPYDVPWLVEAYAKQVRRTVRLGILSAVLIVGAVAGLAALMRSTGESWRIQYLLYFAAPLLIPLFVAVGRAITARSSARQLMAEPVLERRLAEWVRGPTSRTSTVLAFTWLAVLLLTFVHGFDHAVAAAGLVKSGAARGETWRWLTCAFLHAGIWHLWFNAAALAYWGPLVERLAGRAVLGIVLLVAIVAGSAASVMIGSSLPSVGASGGLMGLVGFLIVQGIRGREHLPFGFARKMVGSVGLVAAMGLLLAAVIDNAAHGGGLAAGILAGLLLARRTPSSGPPSRLVRSLGAVAWTILGAAFVLTTLRVLDR